MEAARFPVHLRLLSPTGERDEGRQGPARARRLLSRVELMQQLDAIAELAPQAAHSFLAVRISGLDAVERARGDVGVRFVRRGIAEALGELARGTDLVGELDSATFGVLLQGTGATGAAATAARMTHLLNRLAFLPQACTVLVGSATGTGCHGRRLAWAALEAFEAGEA